MKRVCELFVSAEWRSVSRKRFKKPVDLRSQKVEEASFPYGNPSFESVHLLQEYGKTIIKDKAVSEIMTYFA